MTDSPEVQLDYGSFFKLQLGPVVWMQRQKGLRDSLRNGWSPFAQLVAAEYLSIRQEQRLVRLPGKRIRKRPIPIRLWSLIGFDQADTWLRLAQRSCGGILILVQGLGRVPFRSPKLRDERRRHWPTIAFHGECQRRIGIRQRRRFMHGPVREHGGAAAVALRLPWDLLFEDAKLGLWSDLFNRTELRRRCRDSRH